MDDQEEYQEFVNKISIHRVIENVFLSCAIVFIVIVYSVVLVQNVSLKTQIARLNTRLTQIHK